MKLIRPFLLALATLLGWCDESHSAAPRRGGTLRLATEDDPHTLDPALLFSNHASALSCLIFNSLVERGADGRFSPVLAESLPEISDDGVTFTFRLHSDIRFSNGRELVAQDVVYSFERGCDPTVAANASAFFRNIRGSVAFGTARSKEASEGIDTRGNPMLRRRTPTAVDGLRAPDARTFELRLESPDLTALYRITAVGIVPVEEVCRPDRDFGTCPVGTGAFLLKEWRRGARIRLERNPGSFRAPTAYLDAVDILLNVDVSTQAMMFDRGEIDFMFFLSEPDVHRWRKRPDMRERFVTFKGSCPNYIALNCELPPFTNRLVRQALNYAVNKDAIVRKQMNRGVAARGPLTATMRGYNPALRGYPYDPARARALLAEAGMPNGFETTLWCLPGDKIALAVQEDLRAVGVRAELFVASWPALMGSMQRRRTVPMGSMNGPASDEPNDVLDFLLNGDNITDENCGNMAFYSNPEVQRLLRLAATSAREDRRIRLYQQIEELVIEDAPWIFICHGDLEMFRQPWLQGARIAPFWPPIYLENCWLVR